MNIDGMSDIEKRVKIAEACGYVCYPDAHGMVEPDPKHTWPDYLNDLNAMHDAEESHALDGHWCHYEWNLKEIVTKGWRGTGEDQPFANSFTIHASARQRADAFLLTLP